MIDRFRAVFGRSYTAEPDLLVEQLKGDEAIGTHCCLLSRTSRAWTTTPTLWKAYSRTSRRPSAGADPGAVGGSSALPRQYWYPTPRKAAQRRMLPAIWASTWPDGMRLWSLLVEPDGDPARLGGLS